MIYRPLEYECVGHLLSILYSTLIGMGFINDSRLRFWNVLDGTQQKPSRTYEETIPETAYPNVHPRTQTPTAYV